MKERERATYRQAGGAEVGGESLLTPSALAIDLPPRFRLDPELFPA